MFSKPVQFQNKLYFFSPWWARSGFEFDILAVGCAATSLLYCYYISFIFFFFFIFQKFWKKRKNVKYQHVFSNVGPYCWVFFLSGWSFCYNLNEKKKNGNYANDIYFNIKFHFFLENGGRQNHCLLVYNYCPFHIVKGFILGCKSAKSEVECNLSPDFYAQKKRTSNMESTHSWH